VRTFPPCLSTAVQINFLPLIESLDDLADKWLEIIGNDGHCFMGIGISTLVHFCKWRKSLIDEKQEINLYTSNTSP